MRRYLLPVALLLFTPTICFGLPAFPGAEGMGASATGARGYSGSESVCIVTNTNDSGAGSFRNCVEGSGKEGTYTVFQTSGVINLSSDINITSSYQTIAGETSPGGVSIEGGGVYIGSGATEAHDIIIRHMRFRPGTDNYDGDGGSESQEAFGLDGSYNIILDHCSMSWSGDEVVAFTDYYGNAFTNVTVSWCFISEGLTSAPGGEGNHAYGLFLNAGNGSDGTNTVTVHHSVFAHFQNRIPRATGDLLVDWRNNVTYDWDKFWNASYLGNSGDVTANHVGNYAKPGTNSDACYDSYRSGDAVVRDDGAGDYCPSSPYAMLYMANNAGCVAAEDQGTGGWGAVCGNTGASGLASESWRASSAFSTGDIAVTTTTMDDTYMATVVAGAGATKPSRDDVDTRLAGEIANGTGDFLADVNWTDDSASWGSFSTPAAPTDSDSDGMSDIWETAQFGDLDQNQNTDFDSDGYSDLEEYLHYMAGYEVEVEDSGEQSLSLSGGSRSITTGGSRSITW